MPVMDKRGHFGTCPVLHKWVIMIDRSIQNYASETVLESPGKPVTGTPSILKGYHNSLDLVDGSPSIIVSPV